LTNGRGEENPDPLGTRNRSSRTFWSYGNLISEYIVSSSVSSADEEYKQEATDIWELSKDRQTLTISTEVKEPHMAPEIVRWFIRPEKYKKVFRRVQSRAIVVESSYSIWCGSNAEQKSMGADNLWQEQIKDRRNRMSCDVKECEMA